MMILIYYFVKKKSQQQDNTAQKKVDKELDKYMNEDETDFRKYDPLLWWKPLEGLSSLLFSVQYYLAVDSFLTK